MPALDQEARRLLDVVAESEKAGEVLQVLLVSLLGSRIAPP
jgi:hypothetical protein